MSRDIVAKTGSYTNAQGETKGEYTKIGVILSNDNGEYLMLDPSVNLAGVLIKQRLDNPKAKGMVVCGIYDRQQGGQQPAPQQQAPAQNAAQGGGGAAVDPFDSDVPFAPVKSGMIF